MSGRARVTAVHLLPGGTRATHGLDVRAGGTLVDWTEATLLSLAQAFHTEWEPGTGVGLRAVTSDQVELRRVEAFSYDVVADPDFPTVPGHLAFERVPTIGPVSSTAAPEVGAMTGNILPANCAVVVTFRTILSSKRTRGRAYLPQPTEASVLNDGSYVAGFAGDVLAAYNGWIAATRAQFTVLQPTTDFTQIVLSLMAGSHRDVATRAVGNRVDTQRRRLAREQAI